MIDIAEALGFNAAIVIRKGREGSLAFSLSKPTEVYCTKRTNSGYERFEFEFSHNLTLSFPLNCVRDKQGKSQSQVS